MLVLHQQYVKQLHSSSSKVNCSGLRKCYIQHTYVIVKHLKTPNEKYLLCILLCFDDHSSARDHVHMPELLMQQAQGCS